MFYIIALIFGCFISASELDSRTALVVGAGIGAVELLIAQPLVTLKNRAQLPPNARKVLPKLTIKELWRGVGVASFCLGVNTGIQTGLCALCMPYTQNSFMSALFAVAASAYLIAGPSELIIAQQQVRST